MTNIIASLKDIFDRHPAAPFLFIGSGFSRRYLGLEDWAGLLERFCKPIESFDYYRAKANNDLPQAASLMAEDYYEWWWKSAETKESREIFSGKVQTRADPLKIEICNYLITHSLLDVQTSGFADEIANFADISVDGIITTNWDTLIEEAFPDYTVYVGQYELLFSNPQSIAEIYKIHGTATDPNSLILTTDDYVNFEKKNPYLAAKLVTIFVEHPIIFLGYSINDPHIQAIIESIAQCLPQEKIGDFERNLVFIQRAKGNPPAIEKTTLQFGKFNVSLMVAKVDSFDDVYQALSGRKRKLPARLLRFFKEQMYDFVQSPEATSTKLAVIDYESLKETDDIEFVVGVGVAGNREKYETAIEDTLAKRGYQGISAEELFDDVIKVESSFDAIPLLDGAYPVLGRSNRTFTPVYRYLKEAGVENLESLESSRFLGAKKIVAKMSGEDAYLTKYYKKRFEDRFSDYDTKGIIDNAANQKESLLILPFQDRNAVDLEVLRSYLQENKHHFTETFYVTAWKKLVCWYDKLKYGF